MKVNFSGRFKKFFSKKRNKVISIIVIIALAGVGIVNIPAVKNKFFAKSAVKQRTAVVTKGDLDVTVTGSGPITYTNSQRVVSKVTSTVTKVYFSEGDKVKAGDLICELDSSDVQASVEQTANNSIQSQPSTAVQSTQNAVSRSLKAPFSGRITNIISGVGDTVQNGGVVMTIADTSKLKVTVPFSSSNIGKLSVGQSASVYVTGLSKSVNGTVTYVGEQSLGSSQNSNGQLYNVEIQMNNPGSVFGGMTASADVYTSSGTVSSAASGNIEYVKKQVITSQNGGTITNIYVKTNQQVSAGAVLAQISSSDYSTQSNTSSLRVSAAQQQSANSYSSASSSSSQNQLTNYKIYAPMDGTIVKQNLAAGDAVKVGDVLTTVADMSKFQFDIPVDELDISKISVGQNAVITVDALPDTENKPLTGKVTKVALEGTSTNGVTTFPVTVTIDNSLALKSGMNANAKIEVQKKTDTLFVPIEAVRKMNGKTYVMVKSNSAGKNGRSSDTTNAGTAWRTQSSSSSGFSVNGGNRSSSSGLGVNKNSGGGGMFGSTNSSTTSKSKNSQASYYSNTVAKEVTLGINNDSYVEILSGVSEGQQVILPQMGS